MRKIVNYNPATGLYYSSGIPWLDVSRIFTSNLNIASPPVGLLDDNEIIALTSQTDYVENGIYKKIPGTTPLQFQEVLYDGILIRGINWDQLINPGVPNINLRPLLIAHKQAHPISGESYWQFDSIQNAHPIIFDSPSGTVDIEYEQIEDEEGFAGAPILLVHLNAILPEEVAQPTISVLATTNINVTATGPQTIDGVSLASGNHFVAAGQTTASENDIWKIGAVGQAMERAEFIPTIGTQFHVQQGTFANREFMVTIGVDRGAGTGLTLRRIDGGLMSRIGSDANISIIATRTNELMLPRIHVGCPQLTAIRTYTLPAIAGLIEGTEIILQFETNAPNFPIVVVPNNTGAGERINQATSWNFTISAYRRAHIIFRGGNWWANQFA
jgi:hypothetical protein